MNETTKTTILAALKQTFPGFPAEVQESPEDTATLWVRVFSVPSDQVRAVKDFIHNLEDNLTADAHALLLPMVKNIEVTRQHYPERMPLAPAASLSAFAEQFMCGIAPERNEWKKIVYSGDYSYCFGSAISQREFDLSSIMDVQLQPRRIQKAIIPANEEYALAA